MKAHQTPFTHSTASAGLGRRRRRRAAGERAARRAASDAQQKRSDAQQRKRPASGDDAPKEPPRKKSAKESAQAAAKRRASQDFAPFADLVSLEPRELAKRLEQAQTALGNTRQEDARPRGLAKLARQLRYVDGEAAEFLRPAAVHYLLSQLHSTLKATLAVPSP